MSGKRLRTALTQLTVTSLSSGSKSAAPVCRLSSKRHPADDAGRRLLSTTARSNASVAPASVEGAHVRLGTTSTGHTSLSTIQHYHMRLPQTPRDLSNRPQNPFVSTAPVTLYSFPSYEPVSSVSYPDTHLLLPLRRDILHKAVIFEGDKTRKGLASTKTRYEVHGSNRKIRPQKGTGRARLGDKKSPMLRGGGVAFGPKPRDFSTDLPKKIYDIAWRTALSYKYRRGELIVIDAPIEIEHSGAAGSRLVRAIVQRNKWSTGTGPCLMVTQEQRRNLWSALGCTPGNVDKAAQEETAKFARCQSVEEIDVKDLLGRGRLIMERGALEHFLQEHCSDLKSKVCLAPGISAPLAHSDSATQAPS